MTIELDERAQSIKSEIEDKLKRSTTHKSEVQISEGESLGDLKQYKVSAVAYIKDTRTLPPQTKRLEAESGAYKPFRVISEVTHTDLVIALTQLNDIVQ